MSDSYASIFARNLGLLSTAEQDRLRQATVAIAGVGTVGGLLAERLIRLGVGHLRISDPGLVEASQLNREFGTSTANLGLKKVEAVFTQIKDINPDATIEISDAGVATEGDAAAFVEGADLVVDQRDFGLFRESLLLQRAARQRGIHYMFALAIGFGALVAVFDPQGCTLEEYNGLAPDVDLADLGNLMLPVERIAPIVPSYARAAATAEVLQMIMEGKMARPCISIGAGMAAVLAANEAANVLLRRRDVAVAPAFTYVDLLDRQFVVGRLAPDLVSGDKGLPH